MKKVEIPFSREMAIAAIESRKIATTRSDPKGDIGDEFEILHPDIPKNEACKYFATPRFRIIEVYNEDLQCIRNKFFRLEGFESPQSFEKTWRSLHRGHFATNKDYFIHFFARLL